MLDFQYSKHSTNEANPAREKKPHRIDILNLDEFPPASNALRGKKVHWNRPDEKTSKPVIFITSFWYQQFFNIFESMLWEMHRKKPKMFLGMIFCFCHPPLQIRLPMACSCDKRSLFFFLAPCAVSAGLSIAIYCCLYFLIIGFEFYIIHVFHILLIIINHYIVRQNHIAMQH